MALERIFTWDELALFWFAGDEYGGVAAYCRTCKGGMEPHSRFFVAHSPDGNPLELLRPVLAHIHYRHGEPRVTSEPLARPKGGPRRGEAD